MRLNLLKWSKLLNTKIYYSIHYIRRLLINYLHSQGSDYPLQGGAHTKRIASKHITTKHIKTKHIKTKHINSKHINDKTYQVQNISKCKTYQLQNIKKINISATKHISHS